SSRSEPAAESTGRQRGSAPSPALGHAAPPLETTRKIDPRGATGAAHGRHSLHQSKASSEPSPATRPMYVPCSASTPNDALATVAGRGRARLASRSWSSRVFPPATWTYATRVPASTTEKRPASVDVEPTQALAPIGAKLRVAGVHTATRSRAQLPVFVRTRLATRPPFAASSLTGPASGSTGVFAATSPARRARVITPARVSAPLGRNAQELGTLEMVLSVREGRQTMLDVRI